MLSYLGVDNRGLPTEYFLGVVLARDAVVAALCVVVVRTVLRPERDVVRAVGDDPDWPLAPAPSAAETARLVGLGAVPAPRGKFRTGATRAP
jgi:hypothetical protein